MFQILVSFCYLCIKQGGKEEYILNYKWQFFPLQKIANSFVKTAHSKKFSTHSKEVSWNEGVELKAIYGSHEQK